MPRISTFAKGYLRKRTTELQVDGCRIVRPVENKTEYDPVTRKVRNVTGELLYEGACRMWEVRGGGRQEINGQHLTITTTYVSIPYGTASPEPGDRVTITNHDDQRLVGRSLYVVSVTRGGGLRASTVMSVQFTDFDAEDK